MDQATPHLAEAEPDAQPTKRFSVRLLSSEIQITRFDRWVEFLSATVLALATVATAWCAYQSTIWGGEETVHRAAANTTNIKTAQYSNQTVQMRGFQATLFVNWATAISENNQELADFLFQRFPPALKTATEAWMATEPLKNPDAPSSPFVMPEYRLEEDTQVARWQAEAASELELANAADETSDRYVLLTVLFASVLFFGGIAGKFQSQLIDLGMLIVAGIVLLAGIGILLTFPVQ